MKSQTTKVLAATIATILYSSTTFAGDNIIQRVVDGKVSRTWVLEKEAGALTRTHTSTKLTIDNIPGYLSGQAAIDSFSPEEFEALADKQGLTEEILKEHFLSDPSLKVDANGMLLYMDEGANPEHDGVDIHTSGKPVPAMDAPAGTDLYKLHSKPGAKKVLFIDFTGPTVSNSAWLQGKTIQAVPYTQNIYAIWQAVADDYSGFDVDITTERPSDEALYRSDFYDQNYGITVVVSDSRDMGVCYGMCGGVSYIGVADMLNNKTYQPAWVFAQLYPAYDRERYISSTISHETGHTFGLLHKGVGPHEGYAQTEAYYAGRYHKVSQMWGGDGLRSYAPIMGKGYYASLGQWNNGDYFWSNNRQSDIDLIARVLPLVGDDGLSTKETATSFGIASITGNKVNIEKTVGHITATTDVDYFTFTVEYAKSEVNFLVSNCVYKDCTGYTEFDAGNLHVFATLYDEEGNVVEEYKTDRTSVLIQRPLAPGKYYLAVQGGSFAKKITDETESEGMFYGNSDYEGYTNYGSIGQYTITGYYTAAPAPVDPTVVIDVSKTTGDAPITITFNSSRSDAGNSEIVEWNWTFGDGRSSSEPNPTITYEHSGTFLVSLAIKSKAGLYGYKNMTITVTEPVPPPPPVVVYTGGSTSVKTLVMKATSTSTTYKPYVIVTLKNSKTKIDNASVVTGTFTGTLKKIGAINVKATSVYNKKAKRMEIQFPTKLSKKTRGTIVFTVDTITPANSTIKYDATLNEVTNTAKTF